PRVPRAKWLRDGRTSRKGSGDWYDRLRRSALRSPFERELGMTISPEQAIELARACAEERGWPWLEPVDVSRSRAYVLFGRVEYEVRSNAECRGSNARVVVDGED